MAQIFGCVIWTLTPWFTTSRLMIFYEDITRNVMARFDTWGFSHSRPLPIGVNKKVIGIMKDKLGGRIMTEFVALRLKLYAYKTLGESGDKKCKGVKKCIVKKMLDCEEYGQCLLAGQNMFQKQLMFWNMKHEVHTVEVNRLALSRNDNKRVVQSNRVRCWQA